MLPIQLLKAGIGIVQSFVGAFAVSGNVGELTDKLKELGRRIFGIGVDGKKVTDFFRNLGNSVWYNARLSSAYYGAWQSGRHAW
jgi:hypothetical protein